MKASRHEQGADQGIEMNVLRVNRIFFRSMPLLIEGSAVHLVVDLVADERMLMSLTPD